MLDSSCFFSLITNTDEPRSVKEALGMEDAGSWIEAMDDEMDSLDKKKLKTLYLSLRDGKLLVENGCSRRNYVQMVVLKGIKPDWLQRGIHR